jgi:hypothetical protein
MTDDDPNLDVASGRNIAILAGRPGWRSNIAKTTPAYSYRAFSGSTTPISRGRSCRSPPTAMPTPRFGS